MQTEEEQVHVEFHNNAGAFFALLKNLETVIKNINRQTEEFRLQQVKEVHIHSLKRQLESRAMQLMQQHLLNQPILSGLLIP